MRTLVRSSAPRAEATAKSSREALARRFVPMRLRFTGRASRRNREAADAASARATRDQLRGCSAATRVGGGENGAAAFKVCERARRREPRPRYVYTASVTVLGAFYLTLVPIRPRWRGERRSLRTFSPGVSLRPLPLAFNPDTPRRLSTPLLTPLNSTPTSSLCTDPRPSEDNARWEEAAEVFRAMRDEEGVAPERDVRGDDAHGVSTRRDSGERRTRSRSGSPTFTTSSSTRSCITASSPSRAARGDMAHARAQFDRMRGGDSRIVVTTFLVQLPLGGVRAQRRLGRRGGCFGGAESRAPQAGFVHVYASRLRGGARGEARGSGRDLDVDARVKDTPEHGRVRGVRALLGEPRAMDGGQGAGRSDAE